IDGALYSSIVAQPVITEKAGSYSYKASANAKGTVEIINNRANADFEKFATVSVTRSTVNKVSGGKSSSTQTVKNTVKNTLETITTSTKTSDSASGKFTAINKESVIGSVLNYATVKLEQNARVELIKNDLSSFTESKKVVDGELIEHSTTRKIAPSGTVTLASGASAGSIYGFKTVKLDNASANEVIFGDAYSEKYTLKNEKETTTRTNTRNGSVTATSSTVGDITGYTTIKLTDSKAGDIYQTDISKIVDNEDITRKLAGAVTLKISKVGDITNFTSAAFTDSSAGIVSNVQKVTISKGFNTIAGFVGTEGNDTLTINKNAVLTLGGASFGDAKDKFVNNGTLILSAVIDLESLPLSGKGEIAAASDVWAAMEDEDILNLGKTAEGFRSSTYESADDTEKKAVKWDLKSDYTGWLSGDSDCIDTEDFIKFKTGNSRQTLEISGFAAGDTFKLNDKTYTFDENGSFSIMLYRSTNYVLEFEIDKGDDSMSYTLAVG
ncbi:MAG: hypothetical protein IKB71_03830, partial [Lentisphaeria bacterium]|nr:hypothetical protein [Lentisphaeria bacterium]